MLFINSIRNGKQGFKKITRILECFELASKSEDDKESIIKFIENLKSRKEIRKVYTSGVQNIPESQLFLFIATSDFITDTQCLLELGLAITHDLKIIPIKGMDISFEDLTHIDLTFSFIYSYLCSLFKSNLTNYYCFNRFGYK